MLVQEVIYISIFVTPLSLALRNKLFILLIWGIVGGSSLTCAQDMDIPWYDPEAYAEDSIPDFEAFVWMDREPQVLNWNEVVSEIVFPEILWDAGLSGKTVFRVLIGKKGEYVRHEVLYQVHPILTKTIEPHINQLKFSPAMKEGQPVSFWLNIPFQFCTID
ncbi:MAG: energy transducer TonB [Bacteroidota bacterium]